MSEFWIYFKVGLDHVLDFNAYDHVLFLIALMIPYTFNDWKKVLLLVSLFTIGHTFTLILAVYNLIQVNSIFIEFLIPVTIFVTAFYHLITAGKTLKNKNTISFIGVITLLFGIIHGLGFSNYFKAILPGNASDKLVPSLEFALGIEAAQLIIVLAVLIIAYVTQIFFRFSKKDWALVMSAFVIGVVLPTIIKNQIWNR
ncbi:HupE/UreJ family protein [uncultured Flavobacterium sp.]|uniref:HupE/UreJ family protein n=1 Tax=uncultured Flavobacterium sp. TaxID=165435 RepID=UPI0030CA1F75